MTTPEGQAAAEAAAREARENAISAREAGFRILLDTNVLCEHIVSFSLKADGKGVVTAPSPEYRN